MGKKLCHDSARKIEELLKDPEFMDVVSAMSVNPVVAKIWDNVRTHLQSRRGERVL
jgi:hypothetical protein